MLYLIPAAKFDKSWGTLKKVRAYGWVVKILYMPASMAGFPFGFPCGAYHFQRGYRGKTEIAFYDERNTRTAFINGKLHPSSGSQFEPLVRRLPSEEQIEKEALKRCTEISMDYVHPINKKWFIKGARWVNDWIRQSA